MERCQRKIEHKDCSKIDQKSKSRRRYLNPVVKRLRRTCVELLIYLILFLLVLIVSSTTNKLLPFCLYLWCKFFWELWLVSFTQYRLSPQYRVVFGTGYWALAFRESEEADITAILKHWRIIVYLIFPVIFISTLSLGGLAHLLWLSLPLAACLAVGAALGPYGFGGLCLSFGDGLASKARLQYP